MGRRTFGTTDLETSAVGFGTWALGSDWWGEHEDPDVLVAARSTSASPSSTPPTPTARASTRSSWDGAGPLRPHARQLRAVDEVRLRARRRPQAHEESERPHDWSPEHTRRALEDSLRRLRTDYVDLYQLHNPRMDAIEEDALFASSRS